MFKYDVSVIVPMYNNEKYIEECVKSIMNQKYDVSKIQIIIINDGSTDNSRKICERLSQTYSNILLINKENEGVSEARNDGMKKAEGKYILFLDSDDMIEEETIKNLVNFFDEHYEEVDLVTYPMRVYENENAKPKQHYRNKFFKDGTGIYDLKENPYLTQTTINIIIKNLKENNKIFNKDMIFSEDEAFNTEILMKKEKIGFCQEAIYIYRKNVGSVTKNKTSPYYTFESLMKYHETLVSKYKNNKGLIPKYVQTIILNAMKWRIKRDEIYPYHYDEEKFNKSVERIINILKYIENDMILNMPAMPIYHKFYILKLKNINMKAYLGNNLYTIMSNNKVICTGDSIEIAFSRFKIIESNKLYMLGCIKSPLCEILKPKIFIKYITRNKEIVEEELLLDNSKKSHYQSDIETNTFYQFEYMIDFDEIEKFEFYALVDNTKLNIKYYFTDICVFNTVIKRKKILTKNKKYIFEYNEKNNVFYIKSTTKKDIIIINKQNTEFYDNINYKINIYKMLSEINKKQKIWLYCDANNVYDNGYYQFLHDLNKKDGIERYYVYNGDLKRAKEKFSKKQRKNLIKFGSLKHKIYFLRAKKVLTSDSSLSIYCPFKKSIRWYRDIVDYELIYLQHGILYANLLRLYGKEFTEIDKIVISSEFEKNNLINNYKYKEENLICAGMPRFDIEEKQEKNRKVKKIIYAPSWRKYLVGDLINRTRTANMPEMLKSNFYNKNIEFLTSERLKNVLKENDIILEFKLHPNFRCYKEIFEEYCNENIIMSEDEVSPEKYDMLITDYSSFQFDFIRNKIPIIYFVPDILEFKAGLHTYRKLDLPLEEAFGDVTYEANCLIDKIEKYINDNFKIEEKYIQRMNNFFFDSKKNREKIYQELMKK